MAIRLPCWTFAILGAASLAACAPLTALMGLGQPAIQAAAQIDQAKIVVDGVSYLGSGKTITDHVLSKATGADCRVTNILLKSAICITKSAATPGGASTE
jgi:hypothetical protein